MSSTYTEPDTLRMLYRYGIAQNDNWLTDFATENLKAIGRYGFPVDPTFRAYAIAIAAGVTLEDNRWFLEWHGEHEDMPGLTSGRVLNELGKEILEVLIWPGRGLQICLGKQGDGVLPITVPFGDPKLIAKLFTAIRHNESL